MKGARTERRARPRLAGVLIGVVLAASTAVAASAPPGARGLEPSDGDPPVAPAARAPSATPAAGAVPPNLLFLLVDAQRADHLSSYGYDRPTSPGLDAFAARSVRFTRAVAPSNRTGTSMPSIWTGLLPSRHRVFRGEDFLDGRFVTVAELLRAHGYRTGAWCPNPSLDRVFGFDQGFDVYDDEIVGSTGPKDRPRWMRFETATTINARALAWIDREPGKPFLAWLHYRDVHGPYAPPPPYDTMFPPRDHRALTAAEVARRPRYLAMPDDGNDLATYVAAYDGGVRYTDGRIVDLLGELERRGLLERTVVILTADHGEAFLEHGQWNHDETLYEEELHVPLIVSRPGTPARTIDRVVSTIDLFPTLLELAGVEPPASHGESLVPLLDGRDADYPRTQAFAESNAPWRTLQHAVREGNWKLVARDSIFGTWLRRLELYDLESDPREQRNLADVEPERTARLAAALDDAVRGARRGAPAPAAGRAIEPGLKRELEALGYVE